MKNYFKIGLMALTLAFGVTSCDKQDSDGAAVNALSLEAQGLASKVKFSEDAGLASPKGYENLTAKNHADFDHIYTGGDQILSITNSNSDEVYSGTYVPNQISAGIDPSDIILANGNGYVATSSNASYTGAELTKVVLGYLPYTSRVDFNLSAAADIQLIATLQRGFLIVNAEDAENGSRVTGATANGAALFGPDAEGDFYGYLLAGDHDIVVNYNLNGVSTPINGTQEIGLGAAYTLDLMLVVETPAVVGSDVSTSTRTAFEYEIGAENAGRDFNEDGDLLDELERVVTSTQATLNEEPQGDPVITEEAWYVINDTDIVIAITNPESTEAILGSSVNGPDDTDLFDTITRVVTTTTTSVNGEVTDTDVNEGDWTILEDLSSVTASEDIPDTTDGAVVNGVDTFSAWSAWSPENDADTSVATILQTRTRNIVAVDALDVPAPVGDLSETQTVNNPLYVAPVVANAADEFSYSAFVGEGTAPASRVVSGTAGSTDEVVGDEVEFFTRTITTPRENVVDAYSYVQTRTVSVVVNDAEDTPPLNIADAPLALTQTVEVAESRTDAADHVATEEVLNPNYNQPVDATDPSGIVNITGLSVLGQSLTTITVVAPDGGSASVDGLVITFEGAGQYTVSFTGNALVGDFDVTFTVSGDATGSTFTLPASSESDVAFGN